MRLLPAILMQFLIFTSFGQDVNQLARVDSIITENAKTPSGTLSKEQLGDFKVFVEKKAAELTGYISLIADKAIDIDQRKDALDQAVKLFVDEEQVVQVSNLKAKYGIKIVPVREYFNRLMVLKYQVVKIDYDSVYRVSDFERAADGKYYGTVYFVQNFEAYVDNVIIYSDQTIKKVEVVLEELIVYPPDGKTVFAVKLGNIEVVETKEKKKKP